MTPSTPSNEEIANKLCASMLKSFKDHGTHNCSICGPIKAALDEKDAEVFRKATHEDGGSCCICASKLTSECVRLSSLLEIAERWVEQIKCMGCSGWVECLRCKALHAIREAKR